MIKHSLKLLIAAATITAAANVSAESVKCLTLSTTVKTAVAAKKSSVLELVSTYIGQNESCACEVVKAAITASDAKPQLVADITETAIIAAPSQMRLIGQCAVAVAPDAFDKVQAVLDTYSNVGGSSYSADSHSSKGSDEKSAKDGVGSNSGFGDAPANHNPLNLVGQPGLGGGGATGVIANPGGDGIIGAAIPGQGPVVDTTSGPITETPSTTPDGL